MQRDDIACLHHILDAAGKALTFVKGKTRKDLERDEMLALALVRVLEIVGEAANSVSPAFRDRFPHIPMEKDDGVAEPADPRLL